MPVAVFYISGHGYGHAVRMANVISTLVSFDSDWKVYACTTAKEDLFPQVPKSVFKIRPVSVDAGIVESTDALSIDVSATVARLQLFVQNQSSLIDAEAEFLRTVGADIVVADIPYVATQIGAQAGVPVVGISNFTWDYIYEPFLMNCDWGIPALQAMKEGYNGLAALLRLPFHHEMEFSCPLTDVGLIVQSTVTTESTVLTRLHLGNDTRMRVFVAGRGQMPLKVLQKVALDSPDYVFLHTCGEETSLPENTRKIHFDQDVRFQDIICISHVVISKLGYGMLAACVAGGASLLYPPRYGFREDNVLREAATRYLGAHKIPKEDFATGDWRPYLKKMENEPHASVEISVDGAAQCAQEIVKLAARV